LWSRGRPRTLASQFLIAQLAVIAGVLALIAALSVHQSTQAFAADRGAQMRSVAEYLANDAVVRDHIAGPTPRQTLAPPIARAASLSSATDVTVVDARGRALASTDPDRAGQVMALGTSQVLHGRRFSGDARYGQHRLIVGHAPVMTDDGLVAGAVIAEMRYPTWSERVTDAAGELALYVGVGAALGVAGSLLVTRAMRRRTRGLGTRELSTLADHREALLHSIGEGVMAVDPRNRVAMANDGARSLLGLREDCVGLHIDALGLPTPVTDVLRAAGEAHDLALVVNSRVVVFNQRSARSQGEGIGTVITMRDRTDLVALQNQLDSNLSITDTLRAQTHEFSNQLHTISGLIELGDVDHARHYVGQLTSQRTEISQAVTSVIKDQAIAALLAAKASVAAEALVRLDISQESRVPGLEPALSSDVVTILGNLIDNAIDACKGKADAWVRLKARAENGSLAVCVQDNGPGIPADMIDSIFSRGFSTKQSTPGGRGIGLAPVRMLCERHGGSVTATTWHDQTQSGAQFDVELPWSGP
jgi:two-component system CitB family sensor kinase